MFRKSLSNRFPTYKSSHRSPSTSAQAMDVAERRLAASPNAAPVMSVKVPSLLFRYSTSRLPCVWGGDREAQPISKGAFRPYIQVLVSVVVEVTGHHAGAVPFDGLHPRFLGHVLKVAPTVVLIQHVGVTLVGGDIEVQVPIPVIVKNRYPPAGGPRCMKDLLLPGDQAE